MWSYLKFHKKSFFILAAFCLIGGALGYILNGMGDFHHQHQAIITLESSTPVETQLFYNTGKGFNENESASKVVYQEKVPVTLHFDLSCPKLDGLRFDPSRSYAKIKIHEIILKYQGEKPFSVPLDSLKAVNDIKSIHFDGKALTIETTETAQDPILHLGQIGPAPHAFKLRRGLYILAGALLSLMVAFFVAWVYRNCMNGKETVLQSNKGEA